MPPINFQQFDFFFMHFSDVCFNLNLEHLLCFFLEVCGSALTPSQSDFKPGVKHEVQEPKPTVQRVQSGPRDEFVKRKIH